MDSEFNPIRYDVITEKNPREIVMLRGSGCKWRRCIFCDYHIDFSRDEDANFKLNLVQLKKITGRYHRLEVINSGSFSELDENTIKAIEKICVQKQIEDLHFEMHWLHRKAIAGLKERFGRVGVNVHVKMGVETFDAVFRDDVLKKGMEYALPEEIALYADDICLLFGLSGQTVQTMKRDIETGLHYFQRVCVNIMVENTTKVKPDEKVIAAFCREIYPLYINNLRVDILLSNTDFGVGGKSDEK